MSNSNSNSKLKPVEKLRVTLSVDLLESIRDYYHLINDDLLSDCFQEVERVIGTALYRHAKGHTKPAYTTKPKTLEQLVLAGEASEEQVAEYNKNLMEGL